MNRIVALFIVIAIANISYAEEYTLVGLWKSEEKRTIESMRGTAEVTDSSRKLFEDDFFGKLYVEYTVTNVKSWFEDDDEFMTEDPYEILEETEEYLLVKSVNTLTKEMETKKLYKHGNCYSLSVTKWEFQEYFCKVQQ